MASVFRLAALCFCFVGLVIVICLSTGYPTQVKGSDFILPCLTIYISSTLFYAFRRRQWCINRTESFILLVILWCILPLPIALAFMQGEGLDFVDAYFEASSALTTTGATIINSLESTSTYVLGLRALTQWLGGLLTLIGIVLIMAPAGIGGLPTTNRYHAKGEITINPDLARQVIIELTIAYGLLSLACFLALLAVSVPVFEAFYLTTAAVATGGMVGSDTPISVLGNGFAPSILMFFMAVAGTSVFWQHQLMQRHRTDSSDHREVFMYLGAIFTLGIVFAATFYDRAGSSAVLPIHAAFTDGFFTAASLVSTSGLEIRNGSFSVLPAVLVIVIVLVGGCALSTAGGISFYRVGAMMSHAARDFTKLVYPNSVTKGRFDSADHGSLRISAIWTYFFAVTVVVTVGAIILALDLDQFDTALIAAIAAFSNIGGFYSTGWNEAGPWTTFREMTDQTKIVLCIMMILGRLHILVLLTAFNWVYWSRAIWFTSR